MNDTINQLLHVTRHDNFQGVNARSLHQALQVGRDFSNWVKARLEKAQFIEGLDFITVENLSSPKLASANNKHRSSKSRTQKTIDYLLSIDTAKHLCLMENNTIGQEIRRYFIEAEKQLATIAPRVHKKLRAATADRLAAIDQHSAMTSALKGYLHRRGIEAKPKHYAEENVMMNEIVLDDDFTRWKESNGIPSEASARDYFTPAQLSLLAELEKTNAALLNTDEPQHERRRKLIALAERLDPERKRKRLKVAENVQNLRAMLNHKKGGNQ